MVAPTLVKITRYDPGPEGDASTPFVGSAVLTPSISRHIEGETPPDYVVTTNPFRVNFGAALDANPATPGVAWVKLEPTDYGPDANNWVWNFQFYRGNQICAGEGGSYFVPTSGSTVDFGDLVSADPGPPPPQWFTQLAEEIAARIAADNVLQDNIDAEETARIAADADLQTQINAIDAAERAVSTDGSYGLPMPDAVGLEFVWVGGVLDDIRYDGNSG